MTYDELMFIENRMSIAVMLLMITGVGLFLILGIQLTETKVPKGVPLERSYSEVSDWPDYWPGYDSDPCEPTPERSSPGLSGKAKSDKDWL